MTPTQYLTSILSVIEGELNVELPVVNLALSTVGDYKRGFDVQRVRFDVGDDKMTFGVDHVENKAYMVVLCSHEGESSWIKNTVVYADGYSPGAAPYHIYFRNLLRDSVSDCVALMAEAGDDDAMHDSILKTHSWMLILAHRIDVTKGMIFD